VFCDQKALFFDQKTLFFAAEVYHFDTVRGSNYTPQHVDNKHIMRQL
jgi:hypothetical protein